MEFRRRLGWLFARFVALSVLLLSLWIFVTNLVEFGNEGWILFWVLGSGVAGTLGALAYLLSIDGPPESRTPGWRAIGWLAMMASVVLPSSFNLVLVPLVLALIPTLFRFDTSSAGAVTSS